MYLMAQSCLHVVINFLRPPKPNQNVLYFTPFHWPFHWPLQNSMKFRGNVEIRKNRQILRLGSKFRAPQKTVVPIDDTDWAMRKSIWPVKSTATTRASMCQQPCLPSLSSSAFLDRNGYSWPSSNCIRSRPSNSRAR